MSELPPVPPDGTLEERAEAFRARQRWRAKRDDELRMKVKHLKRKLRRLSLCDAYILIAIIEEHCPELIRPDDDSHPTE